MRRLFWMLIGVGLGAVVALKLSRMLRDTTARYAPSAVAGRAREQASTVFGSIARRAHIALDEGRAEMRVRERELRAELGL